MPTITVNQSQLERFGKFAVPFVDTHETAFEKVLKLAEHASKISSDNGPPEAPQFGLTNLPDLKHTTVTSVRIGTKKTPTIYWNSALIEVLRVAKGKCSLLDATQTLPVNISAEKKTLQGYKWYQDLGVSVQGLAATEAAKTMLALGEEYAIPIEVEFFWQNKPEAAHPGRKGKLVAG